MGKKKQNPLSNILSVRVSNEEMARITAVMSEGEAVQDLLHGALLFAVALREAKPVITKRTFRCRCKAVPI